MRSKQAERDVAARPGETTPARPHILGCLAQPFRDEVHRLLRRLPPGAMSPYIMKARLSNRLRSFASPSNFSNASAIACGSSGGTTYALSANSEALRV